jgi:hypothetical protein
MRTLIMKDPYNLLTGQPDKKHRQIEDQALKGTQRLSWDQVDPMNHKYPCIQIQRHGKDLKRRQTVDRPII